MPDPSAVRRMFSQVAPRYDLLNRLLSLGLDQRWRRAAVAGLQLQAGDRALDICCGTGDLTLEMSRVSDTVACDFSLPMLKLARERAGDHMDLVAGDALSLPYSLGSMDAAAIAFGIRNLADLVTGFSEVHRVLRPGGRLIVLEFSRPKNSLLRRLHTVYVQGFVPFVGGLLSPSHDAYQYLADTIASFPEPSSVVELLHQAGFKDVNLQGLSGGIVTVYQGKR